MPSTSKLPPKANCTSLPRPRRVSSSARTCSGGKDGSRSAKCPWTGASSLDQSGAERNLGQKPGVPLAQADFVGDVRGEDEQGEKRDPSQRGHRGGL